ncbi:F-box/kelch-repeat protein At1g23390-like [Impatiens glandulifera]|uniref:F-box/kelch-repeat protein At1g23390-like n=1 Tax=Impatiens glandulifera TaxID=253017 RepID=UPI001FB0E66E|nr:F-box/kelch-repeat protein At1g23390-like [Impatiens glandulifera]
MNNLVRDDEASSSSSIHGDILESILSRVPLIDLVQASRVSSSWNCAVAASLCHQNSPKPWLTLNPKFPPRTNSIISHSYDPRSNIWNRIETPHTIATHSSALRSDGSNLLYSISPSGLTFSSDPLHLTWHQSTGPKVWRVDPIVSLVGTRLVVAGGGCEFEDDPLSVEVYDVPTRSWSDAGSIPIGLKESGSSTWLSTATDGRRLFVTEKESGLMHVFDPETKIWSPPYYLPRDPTVFSSIITFTGDKLFLIGLIGERGNMEKLKIWSLNLESLEIEEEIGEMPKEMMEEIRRDGFQAYSLSVSSAENWVFIYNSSQIKGVYICEVVSSGGGGGKGCRWMRENNIATAGKDNRMVVTSSKVGIHDIGKALDLMAGNRKENEAFSYFKEDPYLCNVVLAIMVLSWLCKVVFCDNRVIMPEGVSIGTFSHYMPLYF